MPTTFAPAPAGLPSSRPAPRPRSRPATPSTGGPLSRRFRRRRVAVLVFTFAALFGAVRAVAAFGAGPASGADRRPVVHVVRPGETLWSIAGDLRPSGDARGLVRKLAALNGGSSLRVGQRLVLPDEVVSGR